MKDEVKKAIEVLEKATASCAEGDLHIVVLDKGFIFVGNLSYNESTKAYTISNCKNVREWGSGGFGGLTKSKKNSGAILDNCDSVKFHARSLVFTVPVTEAWYDN